MASPDFLVVGKIGAPNGVKGWVKIHSFTRPAMNLLDYQPWLIQQQQQWQTISIEQVKLHGQQILAKFASYDDRDAVMALTNLDIAVTREHLPALANDEYYWRDLEGLTVINQQNQTLGTVDYLIDNGANDVLVIQGEQQHLIPYIKDLFIIAVDLEQGVITVDWDPDF